MNYRFLLLMFYFLHTDLSFAQNQKIEIKFDSNQLIDNRFYYLNEFENKTFLNSLVNVIHTTNKYLQLIDGKNSVSYLIKQGDKLTITYETEHSKLLAQSKKRNTELQFSNIYYNLFQNTFLTKKTESLCLLDESYIQYPAKREKLLNESLEVEIKFLKDYQKIHNLSKEFYLAQYNLIKSFYDEKNLAATHFPFNENYLSKIFNNYTKSINKEDQLYINSYRNAIRFYEKLYFRLKGNIINSEKLFKGEIKDFISANYIIEQIKKGSVSNFDFNNKMKNRIESIKSHRRRDYVNSQFLFNKLQSNELLDYSLNIQDYSKIKSQKLTYIIFWASWCLPCIENLKTTKSIRLEMKNKGLNIVYISLDKNKNSWHKAIDVMDLDKEKCFLIPNSEKSNITHDLKVSLIPHYSIIGLNENIDTNSLPLDNPEILERLKYLILNE